MCVYVPCSGIDSKGKLHKELQKSHLLGEQYTATIREKLVDALTYCHENKVMHRDIKLKNLMLGLRGKEKIADFGWSMHTPSLKRKTIWGTLDYLSPEIIEQRTYNKKVDLWCIGSLCYKLLVGNSPFKNTLYSETYRHVLSSFWEAASFSDTGSLNCCLWPRSCPIPGSGPLLRVVPPLVQMASWTLPGPVPLFIQGVPLAPLSHLPFVPSLLKYKLLINKRLIILYQVKKFENKKFGRFL